MLRCGVQVSCPGVVARCRVQVQVVSRCRVQVSCPGVVSRCRVQVSCPGVVSRCRVQVVSRCRVQFVSSSCPGSCPGVVSRCRVQVVSRCRVQVVSRSCPGRVCPLLGSDHFLCAVSTSIQMDHILPVPCGLPLLRGAPFSCVLIWTCVTGLPRSRNILLPAVLSTWCSENEGWTSYIRSDHPRRACPSAERSPPTTAAILVELKTVCVHCTEWCASGPQANAQCRVSCAIQISSTCFPPHHPQCPTCILDKLARACVRVVGVEPPCCCGHSSTDFPASRRGSARSAGAVARLSWWRCSV